MLTACDHVLERSSGCYVENKWKPVTHTEVYSHPNEDAMAWTKEGQVTAVE